MSDYELPKVSMTHNTGGRDIGDAGRITAAKDHQCCECCGTISKGERYQKVTGLWDGRWSTYRTCDKCAKLRVYLFFGELDCDSAPFGIMRNELIESCHYTIEQIDKMFETGKPPTF